MDTSDYTPKQCTKCKQLFPRTQEYFHALSKSKDGLRPDCKQCRKIESRKNYAKNTDRIKANSAKYQREHPDKHNESNERWKQKRRPVYLAGRKRRYNEQSEQRCLDAKIWRDTHPEQVRIQWKVRQSRKRSAEGNHTPDDIRRIYAEQDGKCAYCEVELNNKFHVDHIKPLSKGGTNWPDNLAIACAKCNLSKKAKTLEEWLSE